MNAELKRRVVHALGKYVLNVPDKLLFAAGTSSGSSLNTGCKLTMFAISRKTQESD